MDAAWDDFAAALLVLVIGSALATGVSFVSVLIALSGSPWLAFLLWKVWGPRRRTNDLYLKA